MPMPSFDCDIFPTGIDKSTTSEKADFCADPEDQILFLHGRWSAEQERYVVKEPAFLME